MSNTLLQADRWLTLKTPLGEDVLVATEVKGFEAVSKLFEFTVSAISSQQTIAPKDILGKSVSIFMAKPGGERRIVNGIATSFSGGILTRSNFRLFSLTVSPTLWLLDRSSDYRVFQELDVLEIAKKILDEGEVAFTKNTQGSYAKRDYCVQFGETNLAFLQRLFAEEGIFYYFTHADGSHKLVLADHAGAYGDCAQDEVEYRQGAEETTDAVYALDFSANLTDSKWTLRDYDFEAPATLPEGNRKTALQPASTKSWEHFSYPGGSSKAAELNRLAKVSIDGTDAGFEVLRGQGTCASFTPGHRFKLVEHPLDDLKDKQHAIVEVRHEAVDRAHFTTRPGLEGKPYYRNSFSCIPSGRPAPAVPPLPKPLARGPQTAVVVGPAGDEIHTDKHGRIRVQFHWDRKGAKDEKSSCYVRVAQGLAGAGWGMLFLPRIGMEVVVQFLDGDPDRPLVTGAVYNGENAPPWALPANATKSGILTRSSKQGQAANANELSFEDKKGEEKVLFHAEKDFTREVENDDSLTVGHDQTRTIKNNRTTTIEEGDETFTISKGNRTETITQGNETLGIDTGNRKVTLGKGNDELVISTGNRTTKLDTGNDELTLSKGNLTTTVTAGNHTTKASAGKITLEAMQGITLKCGSNTVEVTPQGIKLNGMTVTAQGTVKAEIKGPIVDVAGDGMVKINGGIVKIN